MIYNKIIRQNAVLDISQNTIYHSTNNCFSLLFMAGNALGIKCKL